jgi:hypothetical protein
MWLECEFDRTLLSSSEVKKELNYTRTPKTVFMA